MVDALTSNKSLLTRILGRSSSLFQNDIDTARTSLNETIGGASVLIIGAAGSIGSAFVKQLAAYAPAKLHLVDLSENNLVEVVRELRSSSVALPTDFATYAIALGSPEFDAFLNASAYDYVMNFSALKHVRSERDPYTLMRLLHTNVLTLADLTHKLEASTQLFSVSSDKAVNPANLMGSSKALMERVLWGGPQKSSSARFANVAFSDGSLLHSFQQRLAKGQPLSAPTDVRRYFISEQEAGQLCLLACFLGAEREVFVPKLNAKTDLYSFADIARIVLDTYGLSPQICEDEEEARVMAAKLSSDSTQWPCCFSTSDTSGEKAYEEFYSEGDAVDNARFEQVAVVQEAFSKHEMQSLEELLSRLRELRSRGIWSKTDLIKLVKDAVPTLNHQETFKNLDQKM